MTALHTVQTLRSSAYILACHYEVKPFADNQPKARRAKLSRITMESRVEASNFLEWAWCLNSWHPALFGKQLQFYASAQL